MTLAKHYGLEDTLYEARQRFEKDFIKHHLNVCEGDLTKACRSLGISKRSLQYKIKKYELECGK